LKVEGCGLKVEGRGQKKTAEVAVLFGIIES
jgi:hypothetical protein